MTEKMAAVLLLDNSFAETVDTVNCVLVTVAFEVMQ